MQGADIDDCLNTFLMALNDKFWRNAVEVYNIGSEDQTNVLKIAKIVTDAMGLENVAFRTATGPGGTAWQLDISKIRRYGWKPERSGEGAVRRAANELARELEE